MNFKAPVLKIKNFTSGFVCAALLLGCTGAALAAGGQIMLNTSGYDINGEVIAGKGEYIEAPSGAEVPAVISYEDENGGVTNYIPVRVVAEQLNMPLAWESGSFSLGTEAKRALQPVIRDDGSANWRDQFVELAEAIAPPEDAKEMLYLEITGEHSGIIEPDAGCKYVYVTVANNGEDELSFALGAATKNKQSSGVIINQVKPGETVTRTVELLAEELTDLYPYVVIDSEGAIDASVSIMRFAE